ncbi:uncharacterized protein LOC100900103 [Galendromus occidentalis]|uniref:Uncharacterized protein LOC100900103 n=1 Tax=Galendromus occidentalis TaxID=34638 RepID=A0AAJ6QPQ4_9ACAR|nr:uncharacterized protein LOC100900103 [Galendromus occidentalis]
MDSVRQELRRLVAPVQSLSPLIDLERFGSAGKAIRVLALTLRFLDLVRAREPRSPKELYFAAEAFIIRREQRQHFPRELAATGAKERLPTNSKLAAFSTFIDADGLLRVKTRLHEVSYMSDDERNPIVLPGESRFARILIVDIHRINAHFGITTVLSHLRRRYWVTRGRQTLRSVLSRCVVCRREQASPRGQLEAPLPVERGQFQPAFETAGIDFCGHFHTRFREGDSEHGAYVIQKTYVAIFVCTSTRAVHLEAVPSLSAPQTHMALRRFLAIYPVCRGLLSDNGANLVKASTDLKRLFNSMKDPAVRDLLHGRCISWKFAPPRAPHFSGHTERLVGTLKSCLHRTLGRSLVGFEEFRTIIVELAAAINDRPLTGTGANADTPVALTPAMFIKGGPQPEPLATILPIDELRNDEPAAGDALRRQLIERTTYFRSLSVRWWREYIALLRSANQTRGRETPPIELGDVCILVDDNRPRQKYPSVRVIDAHEGRDKLIRTYTVKFQNGKTSRRAVHLLIPLEVDSADSERKSGSQTPNSQTPTEPGT